MSTATMPTKIAASSSMPSMNRSMRLRRGGLPPPCALGSAIVSVTPPDLVGRLGLAQVTFEVRHRLVRIDAGALGALAPFRCHRHGPPAPTVALPPGHLSALR